MSTTTELVRANDEKADLIRKVQVEHPMTLAPEWGIGRYVPICARCTYGDGAPYRYPCPTLVAIGWPEPPELVAGDMRHACNDVLEAHGQRPVR